jgi:hypothetical protein
MYHDCVAGRESTLRRELSRSMQYALKFTTLITVSGSYAFKLSLYF